MSQKITLTESDLIKIVENGVKKVLNEISYDTALSAFAKAGENFDSDSSLYNNPRKLAQLKNLHSHAVDRSPQNFDPNMDVMICGNNGCRMCKAADLEQDYEVTGFVEPSPNSIYNRNGLKEKMVGYPKLKGLIGPMWDGDKIRYETPEVYRLMSME